MSNNITDGIGRRKLLASSAIAAGSGLLPTAVGAASSPDDDDDDWDSGLGDDITIEDGKAVPTEDGTQAVSTVAVANAAEGEDTDTYQVQDFAAHINEGVEAGIWSAAKRGGEITLKLTYKGRAYFQRIDTYLERKFGNDRYSTAHHNCNGVNKKDGNVTYLNDDAADTIQQTLLASGTVMTVAGILIGLVGGLTTGPFGIVTGAAVGIAGALTAAGGSYIGLKNEGCGIKVVGGTDVRTQECDC